MYASIAQYTGAQHFVSAACFVPATAEFPGIYACLQFLSVHAYSLFQPLFPALGVQNMQTSMPARTHHVLA